MHTVRNIGVVILMLFSLMWGVGEKAQAIIGLLALQDDIPEYVLTPLFGKDIPMSNIIGWAVLVLCVASLLWINISHWRSLHKQPARSATRPHQETQEDVSSRPRRNDKSGTHAPAAISQRGVTKQAEATAPTVPVPSPHDPEVERELKDKLARFVLDYMVPARDAQNRAFESLFRRFLDPIDNRELRGYKERDARDAYTTSHEIFHFFDTTDRFDKVSHIHIQQGIRDHSPKYRRNTRLIERLINDCAARAADPRRQRPLDNMARFKAEWDSAWNSDPVQKWLEAQRALASRYDNLIKDYRLTELYSPTERHDFGRPTLQYHSDSGSTSGRMEIG